MLIANDFWARMNGWHSEGQVKLEAIPCPAKLRQDRSLIHLSFLLWRCFSKPARNSFEIAGSQFEFKNGAQVKNDGESRILDPNFENYYVRFRLCHVPDLRRAAKAMEASSETYCSQGLNRTILGFLIFRKILKQQFLKCRPRSFKSPKAKSPTKPTSTLRSSTPTSLTTM